MAILTTLITLGTGALVQAVNAHRETQALQRVMNDLNFTLDGMSRHIRTGRDYRCDGGCSFSNGNAELTVTFQKDANTTEEISYQLDEDVIQRKRGDGDWKDITSPEDVTIHSLMFYELSTLHPRVTIVIDGTAHSRAGEGADFTLQTTLNQRLSE